MFLKDRYADPVPAGERRDGRYCIRIAMIAAVIGTVSLVTAYIVISVAMGQDSAMFPAWLAWPILVFSGLVGALPTSFAVGAPILWQAHAPISRRPVVATVVAGVLGAIVGFGLNAVLFNHHDWHATIMMTVPVGAWLGGLHVVVFSHPRHRRWPRTLLLTGVALATTLGIGTLAGLWATAVERGMYSDALPPAARPG